MDENGTTEDIIEVYSKIQCIAAFNNYIQYIDIWYHPFENSLIFKDNYTGEEIQKEKIRFVKEQKQQKYPLGKSKWKKSIQELLCDPAGWDRLYSCAIGPFTASDLISDIAGQIQKKFVLKLRRMLKNFQEQDLELLMSYFAEIQLSSV